MREAADQETLTLTRWVAGVVLRWRLIVITGLVVLALAVVSVVIIPPRYRATASFVANSSSGRLGMGLGAALGGGALGGIAAQLGMSAGGDPSESPAFYDRLLHSRELLTRLLLSRMLDPQPDRTADSTTLLEILDVPGRDHRRRLETGVKLLDKAIVTGFDANTGIVSIRFDARWAELSAAVVNRAVDLVSEFNREQRSRTLRTKRMFLEDRSAAARAELESAEAALRHFHEQNRLWRNSPSLMYEEQQLQRRVDLASDLFLVLRREYDVARLDEINSAALITVIDAAVPARKPQWPRYGILLMTVVALGTGLGFALAGGASVWDDWRGRNPESLASFREAMARARSEIADTLRAPGHRRRRRAA